MGADFNIKPAGAIVAAPVMRPLPQAAQEAVSTQLPPSQSVVAVDESLHIRNDTTFGDFNMSRQVSIDRAAGTIVTQVIDAETRLVIKQFPDEALLRSRAYARALDDARLQRRPFQPTDLTA